MGLGAVISGSELSDKLEIKKNPSSFLDEWLPKKSHWEIPEIRRSKPSFDGGSDYRKNYLFITYNLDREIKVIEEKPTLIINSILTRKALIKDILSFKVLNNNWDGYGAYPLEVESAANAITVINSLAEYSLIKVDEIFPNPHGTISIILKSINTISIEIGNDSMSYYVLENGKEPLFFDDIDVNLSEIESLETFI